MSEAEDLMIELYEIVKRAIKSRDWVVDGACDPDATFDRIKQYLASKEAR